MNREQARQNFKKVSQGKRLKANVALADAKERLRRVDEDLDIGPALVSLSKGDWQSALIVLAPLAMDKIKKENLLVFLLARTLPFVYQAVFTSRESSQH